jgi:hypothetical protein
MMNNRASSKDRSFVLCPPLLDICLSINFEEGNVSSARFLIACAASFLFLPARVQHINDYTN